MEIRNIRKIIMKFLCMALILTSSSGITFVHAANQPLTPTENMRIVDQFYPHMIIEDFESDTAAYWRVGENVSDVSIITQAHNVFFPYEGDHFLGIISDPNLQNNVWRTAERIYDTPLDLTDYRYLMMGYDHFGYLPNDEPYYARLTLYSGDSSIEGIVRVFNNNWNRIGIDISDWEGRSSIDKLEVGFIHDYDRADYPEDPLPNWPGMEFYVDYIHAANHLGWAFSYDDDREGWDFSEHVTSPIVTDGHLQFAVDGDYMSMTSAPIKVDAEEVNVVTLRLRNETSLTSGTLYWTTATESEFHEERSQTFALNPNGSSITDYTIRLISDPSWSGTITQLRMVFSGDTAAAGTMIIDEISFSKQDRPIYEYIGAVTDIYVDGDSISVTGAIGTDIDLSSGELLLYELAPYQYEQDTVSLTPLQSIPSSEVSSHFTFNIDRYDGYHDRYYSKFLVVLQGAGGDVASVQYVDHPKAVTTIDFPAQHQFPYPQALSKKGLNVQMSDDAEDLGVSHATFTVVINGLMYGHDVELDNAISFEVNGETYYFRRDTVRELDAEIKSMSDNGTVVNLVLILYDSDDPDGSTNILIHPDAARGQGTVYAFNNTNEEGIRYYTAAIEFLANRYTREDEKFGRAMGYIVGNEVDSGWVWQNMGDKTVDQFMEHYERSVRLAYLAVRKHSDSARVYISIDNAWNEPYYANQPTRFYKGKDIVDKMNALSKQGGDYLWHLAQHPYPENMLNPTTWNDHEKVTGDYDTPKITFKNIHLIDDYMGEEHLRFNGERRRIILSEQGFHTPDGSLQSQLNQAAAYVYAYYKTRFLDGIDTFIMFNQLDIPSAGLNMGLWTQDPDMAGFVAKEKKYIYDIFKYIDTERSLEISEFAKEIIGIQDWSEIVPNFDALQLDQRDLPELFPLSLNKRMPDLVIRDEFETGVDGWERADHAESVSQTNDGDIQGGVLRVDFVDLKTLTFVGLEKLWKGADKKFDQPFDASNSPYLNLSVKLTEPVAAPQYVKVKAYSGDQVAEGIARINTEQGWNHLSLDLRGWDGLQAVDRIKVWTKKLTNDSWSGSMLIDDVGFSQNNSAVGAQPNIDIVATVEQDILTAVTPITIDVTNYGDKKLSGVIHVGSLGDLSISSHQLFLHKLETGGTQRFTIQVDSAPADGKGDLQFTYRNIKIVTPIMMID